MDKLFKRTRQYLYDLFHTDVNEALLTSVTCRLLLFNKQLYNLETKQQIAINDQDPQEIAKAAAQITTAGSSVALYLPATGFMACSYQLPSVSKKDIHALLTYQQSRLIPAYPEPLLVSSFHQDNISENYALWYDASKAVQLYTEFNQHNLSLLVIQPSIFSFLAQDGEDFLIEETDDYYLLTEWRDNSLTTWDLFYKADLSIASVQQLWQQKIKDKLQLGKNVFKSFENRSFPAINLLERQHYAFFPEPARSLNIKHSRVKSGRIGILLAVIVVLLLSIPFIAIEVRIYQEKEKYDQSYQLSKQVREYKSYVLSSEETWAAYQNFPKVNMIHLLETLDSLIPQDSWLTSLSYQFGKIEIKGNSPDPSKLLEIISQQEAFRNSAFSQNIRIDRGKKNQNFGITFELDGVDYQRYKEQYFPELLVFE